MFNATLLAWDHPDLKLVKGYAQIPGAWLGHWWCADTGGRVLDPSWANKGIAYVGIEVVDVKAHSARIAASGFFELEVEGSVHDSTLIAALEAAVEAARCDEES